MAIMFKCRCRKKETEEYHSLNCYQWNRGYNDAAADHHMSNSEEYYVMGYRRYRTENGLWNPYIPPKGII